MLVGERTRGKLVEDEVVVAAAAAEVAAEIGWNWRGV